MIARILLLLIFAMTLSGGASAADIRAGATLQVKANSVWFQNKAKLTQWQGLKKIGSARALKAYEERVLRAREAWQFLEPLAVQIKSFDAGSGQARVTMTAEGRMQDTEWLLDAGVFEP